MVDLEANVLSYGTLNPSATSSSRRFLRVFLYGIGATALLAITCAVGLVLFNGDRTLPFATLEQIYNPLTGSFSTQSAASVPKMNAPVFREAMGTDQLDAAPAAAAAAPAGSPAATNGKAAGKPAGKAASGKPAGKTSRRGTAKVDRWFNPITGEISYQKPKGPTPGYGKAMYGYAASVPEIDERTGPADDSPKISREQSAKKFWEELGLGDQYVANPNYNPKYNPGGADADLAGDNAKKAAKAVSGKAAAGGAAPAAAAAPTPAAPAGAAAAAPAAPAAPAAAVFAVNKPVLAFRPSANQDDNSELAIAERDEEAATKAAAQAKAFQQELAKEALGHAPQPKSAVVPPQSAQSQKMYSAPEPQPMFAPAPGVAASAYPRSEQREIVQPQVSTGLYQPPMQQPAQPTVQYGAPMVGSAEEAPTAGASVEYAAPMQRFAEEQQGPEMMAPPMNPELAAAPPRLAESSNPTQNVETVAEADAQYSAGYTQ